MDNKLQKTLGVFFIVLAIAILGYFFFKQYAGQTDMSGTAATTPQADVSSGMPFNTAVVFQTGQTVTFADGLILQLEEVDDSRCKPGSECLWAGELSPLFAAGGQGASIGEVRLGTVNNMTIARGNYVFNLISATENTAQITVSLADGRVE